MPVVVAVVVAYHPEITSFLALLDRLAQQTQAVVVVDNSSREDNSVLECIPEWLLDSGRFSVVRLGGNFGIASALNIGIQEAVRSGAEFVLLSDQDSLPAEGMVERLCFAYNDLTAQGFRVAAVGPTFSDLHTFLTFPFQVQLPGKFFYQHSAATTESPYVEALSLITSGSLIPAEVFASVGPMREEFFIDNVDVEWCHRARSVGYSVFGTGLATMYQSLGEARVRVWYMGWRYESEYNPIRTYYRLRNLIALWKLGYIDWRWKVRNSWYGMGVVYTHTLFARKENAKHLLLAIKGVWHGLINRMGRYEGK